METELITPRRKDAKMSENPVGQGIGQCAVKLHWEVGPEESSGASWTCTVQVVEKETTKTAESELVICGLAGLRVAN